MSSRCPDARDSGLGTRDSRDSGAARRLRVFAYGATAACVALASLGVVAWASGARGRHEPRLTSVESRVPAVPGPDARVSIPASESRVLRVCADPNNLPFSNATGQGFENKLAELVAHDLGARVEYTWWPQRRAWVRNTINAHRCDLAVGVPAGYERLLTTRPYYESAYVFVSRTDRRYGLQSLDDPRLRTLRIGLHFIGDDYNNPPPAHALGARGIVRNVVGFSIYGNYSQPNPPARLIDAVARGNVDVAIAWGPLAGYFARREPVPLTISVVEPLLDRTGMQFAFPIAMGVHQGNTALRDEVQQVLDRRRSEIRGILKAYGVPLVGQPAERSTAAGGGS